MLLRKSFLTIWLCTVMFFASTNMAHALNLVSDGQGAYYAADNHDYLLINTSSMGPISMWYMLNLASCEKGTYDGREAVYGDVYMITSDSSDSTGGVRVRFVFFSNGVSHAPGGTYQTISGSNAYRAAKVIFDRANGKGSSGGSSSSSSDRKKNALNDDEIAIGGVSPGASVEYVKGIYGAPDSASESITKSGETWEIWKYGDSFELRWYKGEKEPWLFILSSTAANGLATPKGIKVGSRASEVLEKYGEPFTKNSTRLWYKGKNDCDFIFDISNGVVTRIAAGWSY